MTGYDMVLPMNSGAEAVETAIKTARKWGYQKKGIPADQAEIIACANNFHGRTISIISFSTEPLYRDDFGPFTPGFKIIPFDDVEALELAITPFTAAFIVEPIQAEAGILIPSPGYLRKAKEICAKNNVLFIADEIQTGLGRTGKLFACEHEGVKADMVVIGKSLGGGCTPISAVLASSDILGVFKPGEHGSTFGGNPLSCAVAREALRVIKDEKLVQNAAKQGRYFVSKLKTIKSRHIKEVRGRGLLIGRRAPQGSRRGAAVLRSAQGRRTPLQGDARPRHPLRPAARHPEDGSRLGLRADQRRVRRDWKADTGDTTMKKCAYRSLPPDHALAAAISSRPAAPSGPASSSAAGRFRPSPAGNPARPPRRSRPRRAPRRTSRTP